MARKLHAVVCWIRLKLHYILLALALGSGAIVVQQGCLTSGQ